MLTACTGEIDPTPTAVSVTPTAIPPIGVDFATRLPPTAVVRQLTPTPLPTPTVTPSPTPIVFVVESGDTLLGIAIDHDTTTEEIVALNPGIDPRFLLIGQEIILPPPEILSTNEAGLALDEDTAVLEIVSLARYDTPQGTSWLMGEVQNVGTDPAENIQISLARLADPTGDLLDTAVVWAATALLWPGEKAPFGVSLPTIAQSEWQPVVTNVSGAGRAGSLLPALPLVATDVALQTGDPPLVTANLLNTGAEAVDTAVVTITLYNATGQVVGFTQRPLPQPLAPNDQLTLTVPVVPPGGTAVTAQLTIDN
jgi:LysM repeat protein